MQTIHLPAGSVLTVTAAVAATLTRLLDSGEPDTPADIDAGASASVGPFGGPRRYAIDSEIAASYAFTTPDPLSDGDPIVAPVITGGSADGLTSFSLADDVYFLSTAGAPVDYTDGTPPATGEGVAGPGSLCVRRDTGKLYVNGGTKAQPLWKLVTSAA
jgi:hypothetical protein